MARKFYCANCGKELTHLRKAVPGKGLILDLIKPHNCEGFVVKDSNKPTILKMIENLKPIVIKEKEENLKPEPQRWFTGGDQRSDIKTTAPEGAINAVKGKLS